MNLSTTGLDKTPLQYLVGGIASLAAHSVGSASSDAGAPVVEDQYLVAHLGHASENQATDLLQWTVDGEVYTLRVCGMVRFKLAAPQGVDHEEPGSTEIFSAYGLTKEYLDALAQARKIENFAFDESPFFEWLDSDDNPVGDVFDSISLNPEDEVASLLEMLEE